MWEVLLLELRASYTSKNSQVRNYNEVDDRNFLTDADPQGTFDDNGDGMQKQEVLKIHSCQLSQRETIVFGKRGQKLSEISPTRLYR